MHTYKVNISASQVQNLHKAWLVWEEKNEATPVDERKPFDNVGDRQRRLATFALGGRNARTANAGADRAVINAGATEAGTAGEHTLSHATSLDLAIR